ncbi:MAG: DUF1846 family protein [Bacilli bacterium]
MKKGFDNKLYVKVQSKKIKERIEMFDKLYLEIGGKLFNDTHAARVLPGFLEDSKINMFLELKKDLEIIFCINASDIEKNKTRAEFGITYDMEIIKLINSSVKKGFLVNSVVITLYNNQPSVNTFINKLERHNIKTYIHTFTKGYPTNTDLIVSDEGYGANPFIKTTKKLILVNAPGPGSGKLATCLSQLYHEHKLGVNAGYAKFETFPVWDLPLKHPVNLAYEAATADLRDVNMIDYFHLEKYGVTAVNYNRDLETFPILKNILNKIMDKDVYFSPTDMGVNMIGSCITNMDEVIKSSKKEIVRRNYQERCKYKQGIGEISAIEKTKLLMNETGTNEFYLKTVKPALEKSKLTNTHVISLELPSGKVITGKETSLLSPSSSLIINAIKVLSKIPDNIDLLSKTVLEPILSMHKSYLHNENSTLELNEVLLALSICAVTNPMIENAIKNLEKLKNCDAHATYIIEDGELNALKNLKINLTCEPCFYSEILFL